MKLAIVISSNDPETVFNAVRFGNFALKEKDEVGIFLIAKGVEMDTMDDPRFDTGGQARAFVDGGGKIWACGTCLKIRESNGSEICPLSTMKDLYNLVKMADKVVSF